MAIKYLYIMTLTNKTCIVIFVILCSHKKSVPKEKLHFLDENVHFFDLFCGECAKNRSLTVNLMSSNKHFPQTLVIYALG